MCAHVAQAMMLQLGKHRGKRFCEVAEHDRNYCAWVLRASPLPQGFERFVGYLKKNHGGLMCMGKHKGRFYDEIVADDPGYVYWAHNLADPSDALADFIKYAEQAGTPQAHAEPPPKRQCAGAQLCIMCCERAINTAFVPCGHAVACMECGARFSDADCPMCKQCVCLVLRTYGA